MKHNKEIDAIGLKCPMPILKCKKGMSTLDSGEILKIQTTDKGAPKDFAAFCDQTGHSLLSAETKDEISTFYLRKK